MLDRLPALLPFVVFAAAASWAETFAHLDMETEPVSITLTPVDEGHKVVRLPALEYRIRVHGRCAAEQRAESVSISAADTQAMLTGAQLADAGLIVVDLVVPAQQLAPLIVDGFCSSQDRTARELLVESVVMANLSLRCAVGADQSITYAAHPLAVMLKCDRGDEAYSGSLILR